MFSFMQHATFYFVLVLLSFMVNKWPFLCSRRCNLYFLINQADKHKGGLKKFLLNFKARNDCHRIMKSKIILECAKHSNSDAPAQTMSVFGEKGRDPYPAEIYPVVTSLKNNISTPRRLFCNNHEKKYLISILPRQQNRADEKSF